MKIAIFSSYGANFLTEEMKVLIERESFVEDRARIAEYLEKKAKECEKKVSFDIIEENFFEIKSFLEKNKNDVFLLKNKLDTSKKQTFIYYDDNINYTSIISVVDVDISKKWNINTYDGAEGVNYYEEPKLIEEKYNYYDF